MKDILNVKVFIIGVVALVCLVASMFVLNLVAERAQRFNEAKQGIADTWGRAQTLAGPVLVLKNDELQPDGTMQTIEHYVLPKTLTIESSMAPETRSKGMFDAVVHTETIQVQGTFDRTELALLREEDAVFAVSLSDIRSIENQIHLSWQNETLPFAPGSGTSLMEPSGLHVPLRLSPTVESYSFSFSITVRGSGPLQFLPLGEETQVTVNSVWQDPTFVGAFLPSERNFTNDGFNALWRVSSFGRSYPQSWTSREPVHRDVLYSSAFGVELYQGVDLYTQVERSVKYAVLFILVTFTAFFLFEVLIGLRIHPVQYLLVGAALALFYLLLLSLTEHIGFALAYLFSTFLITSLIALYSSTILGQKRRVLLMLGMLYTLYGYLYFVLRLEDYALLFGSLLVFVLLAVVMYLTRNIDWFNEPGVRPQ